MKKFSISSFLLVLALHMMGQSPAKVAVTQQINDSIRTNGTRQITGLRLNAVLQAINNVNMDSGQVLNTINAQKGIVSGIPGLINGKVVVGNLPLFVDSVYRRRGVDSIYYRIANTGLIYAILDSAGTGGAGGATSMSGDATASISGTNLPATVTGIRGAAIPALSNGFLKQNGGTWFFDNSIYITGNQVISFTGLGDVSTAGGSSPTALNPVFTITGLKGSPLPSLIAGFLRFNGTSWVFDTNTYMLASSLSNVVNSLQVINQGGSPGILSSIFASRPAAGTVGNVFISTDTKEIYRDNGSAWDLIGTGSAGGGSDSGFAVLPASLGASNVPLAKLVSGPKRFILWDTLPNNPAAIVTQASRRKLEDSINALIAQKVSNALGVSFLGYGPYASKPTVGTGLYFASDSTSTGGWFYINGATATNLNGSFNVYYRGKGRGDTTGVYGVGSNVFVRGITDSLDFHHLTNSPDSGFVYFVQAHDSTSINALQTKYRSDTARANLYAALAGKVANNGASTGIKTGIFSARPAASNCQCFYASTTDSTIYYDNGSWIPLQKASSAGGGTDTTHGAGYNLGLSRSGNKVTYYSTDTTEGYVGQIYRAPSFASLTGWTNNGSATFTATGGVITASGGAGLDDFTNSLDYNYYTGADQWSMSAVIKTGTAAANVGMSIGIRSTNTFVPSSLAVQFDGSNSSHAGRVYIRALRGVNFVRVDSTTALSFTAGDKIEIQVLVNRFSMTVIAKDQTTNSSHVSVSHNFGLLSTSDVLPNTGHFSIWQHGGAGEIDSVAISIYSLKNPALGILMDSRGYGDYVGDYGASFAQILQNRLGSVVNLSKPGDRVEDILNRIPEAQSIHAKQWIFMAGINNIIAGSDTNVVKTNIASINSALTAQGAKVWFLLPWYSSVQDQTWLKNYIVRTYPNYIDTWTPSVNCSDCRATDNIHYNALGNRIMARIVLDTNVLVAGRTRLPDSSAVKSMGLWSGNDSVKTVPFATVDNQIISDNSFVYDPKSRRMGIYPGVGPSSGLIEPVATIDVNTGNMNAATYLVNHSSGGSMQMGPVSLFKSMNGLVFNGAWQMGLDNSSLSNMYLGSPNAGTFHLFDRGGNDFINANAASFVSNLTISGGSAYAGGSNTNAGTFQLNGATGSGTGTPGDIVIGLSSTTTSGSTSQSITNKFWFKGSTGSFTNKSSPSASAVVDLSGSTTQGFLPPVVNTTQMNAISSPATGLLVYNSDSLGTCVYTGTAWLRERISVTGGTNYQTVQSNSVSQTARPRLNFGPMFTLADNSGNTSTDVNTLNTIITDGSQPGIAAGAAVPVGGGATYSFGSGSNAVKGRINLTTGTGSGSGNQVFTITLPTQPSSNFQVFLQDLYFGTHVHLITQVTSATTFTINIQDSGTLLPSTSYIWAYYIVN